MNEMPCSILVVDDEPAHLEAIRRSLEASELTCNIRMAGSLGEYRNELKSFTPDIVLMDLNLPDGRAVDILSSPPEESGFPILVMTSFGNEQTAVEALKAGALDYVVKSQEAFLKISHTIERSLREWNTLMERRRAERALRESEEIFRQIAESSRDVYWLMTPEPLKLLYISPSYERVFQRPRESLFREAFSWLESVQEEDCKRVKESFDERLLTGLNEEFRIIKQDGSTGWIWARTFPITDGTGRMVRLLGVASEITDRKTIEEQNLTIQKLDSIGLLAGGIAHDFNNLLTGILGNIGLAKSELSQTTKAYYRLEKSEIACDMAKELSFRLLTFAKGGSPVKHIVSINQLLLDAVGFSLSGSNVKGRFEIARDLYYVEIDENQIKQVIYNMVINALEAMPEGGILKVSAANIKVNSGMKLSLEPGNYITITLEDNGTGIPAGILPKIFDPYFSSSGLSTNKGKGLGLAICHSIVQKHEGLITVDSQVGVGTTFNIYLPAFVVSHE